MGKGSQCHEKSSSFRQLDVRSLGSLRLKAITKCWSTPVLCCAYLLLAVHGERWILLTRSIVWEESLMFHQINPLSCWWNKPPCFPKPCTQATQVSQKGWKSIFVLNCLPFFFFFFFLVLAFVLFVLFEGGNSVLRRDEAWHAAINSQWASYIFRQFWEGVILLVFCSCAIYHVGLTESWNKG